MLSTAWLLLLGLLAGMTPLQPGIHPDDLKSVSCFSDRHCLFLDDADNLLFSPNAGKTLRRRSRHPAIGLTKIRFVGMIDGWGLDRRGGVWRSSNGGRTFAPVSLPDQARIVDLATGPGDVILATGRSRLLRMNSQARITETLELPAEPVSVSVSPAGGIAMIAKDGKLQFSEDGKKSFKPVEPSKKLARLGDFLSDGRLVAFDGSGAVLLGSPQSGDFLQVALEPQDAWNDVSRTPSGLILAGPAGSRVSLTLDEQGRFVSRRLGQAGSGVGDVQFLDRRYLVVSFLNGEIRTSGDGGGKLSPAGRLEPKARRISFVDPRRGFALVGAHLILSTNDGGKNWQRLGYWGDLSLTDLYFHDRRRGWAVGRNGCIVSTRDGGLSWTIKCLPIYSALHRVHFSSSRHGWIVGEDQTIFRTRDGGRSWTKMHTGKGTLLDVFFISADSGWAVGDTKTVLHTSDGGDSWTSQALPADIILRSVVFVDRLRGLAAGDDGRMLLTKNGGRTWKLVELPTRAGLNTVSCHAPSARCLVGGENGLLLIGNPFRFYP